MSMHTFFNCSFEAARSGTVTKHLGSIKPTKKCSDVSHEADSFGGGWGGGVVSSASFFFPLKLNLAPVIRAKLAALNNNVICLLTGEVQQGQPSSPAFLGTQRLAHALRPTSSWDAQQSCLL